MADEHIERFKLKAQSMACTPEQYGLLRVYLDSVEGIEYVNYRDGYVNTSDHVGPLRFHFSEDDQILYFDNSLITEKQLQDIIRTLPEDVSKISAAEPSVIIPRDEMNAFYAFTCEDPSVADNAGPQYNFASPPCYVRLLRPVTPENHPVGYYLQSTIPKGDPGFKCVYHPSLQPWIESARKFAQQFNRNAIKSQGTQTTRQLTREEVDEVWSQLSGPHHLYNWESRDGIHRLLHIDSNIIIYDTKEQKIVLQRNAPPSSDTTYVDTEALFPYLNAKKLRPDLRDALQLNTPATEGPVKTAAARTFQTALTTAAKTRHTFGYYARILALSVSAMSGLGVAGIAARDALNGGYRHTGNTSFTAPIDRLADTGTDALATGIATAEGYKPNKAGNVILPPQERLLDDEIGTAAGALLMGFSLALLMRGRRGMTPEKLLETATATAEDMERANMLASEALIRALATTQGREELRVALGDHPAAAHIVQMMATEETRARLAEALRALAVTEMSTAANLLGGVAKVMPGIHLDIPDASALQRAEEHVSRLAAGDTLGDADRRDLIYTAQKIANLPHADRHVEELIRMARELVNSSLFRGFVRDILGAGHLNILDSLNVGQER